MLSFRYDADTLVEISADYLAGATDRNDMTSLDHAERIAADATALTGELHIGVDRGRNCYPRFDVIRAPHVGDAVSGSFNGDSYPEGHIVSVSPTLKKVTTSTGAEFFRRKQSGSWIKQGTWSLIQGHESRRNPSF